MTNFDIRTDAIRNRLYVKLAGFLADAEMEKGIAQVIAALPKLKPGFVLISDISELKPAGAKALARAMEAYKRHGIARIVRIVGRDVLGKMQFQRVAQEAAVQVEYVHSAAEAEAAAARS